MGSGKSIEIDLDKLKEAITFKDVHVEEKTASNEDSKN
jgi:hypothetical protein